jgi:HD-GYP domain-containing protein (c-di-GMP phosphodiesterase class II)
MGAFPAHRLLPLRSELLQPGMYVAELDRSWLHTPFQETGFMITGPEQVEQLRRICRYVYVDPARSELPDLEHPASVATGEFPAGPLPLSPAPAISTGQRLLDEALQTTAAVVRTARRNGALDIGPLLRSASAITGEVLARTDLMLWLIRVDERGGYLYRRAVGSAVIAVVFGRQLGMDQSTLEALATGALLLDIGKIVVPVPILAKPDALNVVEQAYVRRHVERGLELLSAVSLVPPRAVEMLAGHHERLDGSGYPAELKGTRVPLFARLAAIVDTYDALTLNRRYAAAMSPHAALRFLDTLRDEKFDGALVGEFIHALGVYPTGTWVELLDGSVGLVCAQQAGEPLRPLIVVALDERRQMLPQPRVVQPEGGTEIVRALPPNIAPVEIRALEPALQPLYAA